MRQYLRNENLDLKDLINIGVFSTLFFFVSFICGNVFGVFVITLWTIPFFSGIFTGPVTIFFLSKIRKKWATFLYALSPVVLSLFMGNTFIVFFHALFLSLFAEYIKRRFYSPSGKENIYCHIIITLCRVGWFLQLIVLKDQIYEKYLVMMGEDYANSIISFPDWAIIIIYFLAALGGYIGGKIGMKLFKNKLTN
ncbi:MAG: hypothetical protein CSA15_01975 [Candidatus Delongbacteria bacterium]|nr:MAG: hypothetical protein CSA15_01975 [Candidatus Delongbacteria bacterium]